MLEEDTASSTRETDVLVVGGGVVGCAAALYLAKEGAEVSVVEQHDIHTQASGSNAGNIHQQLLPANHIRTRGWEWIAHQAGVVRYHVAAGLLWRELAQELDCDVEMQMLGGITVAESDLDMQVIERKSQLERRNGGESVCLSRADLRSLAPYLSDDLVGGSYCSAEGKANPLLAVSAIARLAAKLGARFFRREKAVNVQRENLGFRVTTQTGQIRCRRLIVAAGMGTPEIARFLGVEIPFTSRVIQTAVSEAATPIMKHLLYHVTRPLTMKQVTNGNVIMGGGWPGEADPVTGDPRVRYESVTGGDLGRAACRPCCEWSQASSRVGLVHI